MELFVYSFMALTATTLVKSDAHSNNYAQPNTGCYDCNYAPSGFVKGYEDWQQGSAEVGYMKCALAGRLDRYFVHKNPCRSSRCYIRQEENGMVYRGCADYENLPWDVNTDVNCKYQGPSKSLWYFCDGHACNHGQLGDTEERCGSPPPQQPKPKVIEHEPVTNPPVYEQPEYPVYYNHFQSFNPYNQWGGHLLALNLFPYYGYRSAPEYMHYEREPPQEEEQEEEEPQYPLEVVTQPPPPITPAPDYNPCDGKCHYNPSGLFADKDRPDHFIQCGCDFKGGRPCTCCQKFYLKCDPNTYFDDSKKVCVRPNLPY